jgi:hypothetical protein
MKDGGVKLGYHFYGHIYIYHNTFYSTHSSSDGLMQANYSPGTVTSRNNIYYVGLYVFEVTDNRPAGYAQDCDYDFMYTADSSRFVKWEGQVTYRSITSFQSRTSQELNGITSVNIGFVNASGGDLHLLNGSLPIDKGTPLLGFNDANSPWPTVGPAPDIGAYEGGTAYVPVQPPSGGGGYVGGGGTGGSGGGGITSLRYSITSKGVMLEDLTATDINMKVELRISIYTIVKNQNNQPPTSIRIEAVKDSLPLDSVTKFVGLQYEIGQSGITFDPSATLVFKYKKSELPEDIPEENLFIGLWDPDAESWQDMGGTLDTSALCVSTNITHLSTYALMAHARPAEFTVSAITLTPGEVSPGEPVTASVIVSNQGDLSGNYTASLKMDDILTQEKEVTLSGGSSKTISFDIVKYDAGEYRISIDKMLATLRVKQPLSPAVFSIGELSVNPLSLEVGENIIVSVPVQNTGDISGTYRVTLMVDDNVVDTKEVTLDSAGSTTLEFSYVSDTAGTHTATIEDQVVPFEVKDRVTQTVNNTEVKLDIDNSSVTPSFSPSTNKLVYTRIIYKMDQPWESLEDYELLLSVSHDDQLLAQVPLLISGQLREDGQTGELNYIPDNGWTAGQYTFQIELYHGGNLIQTAEFLPVTVESKSTTSGISWMNLGAIIGSVFFAGIIALAAIFYLKRKNIRHYWK